MSFILKTARNVEKKTRIWKISALAMIIIVLTVLLYTIRHQQQPTIAQQLRASAKWQKIANRTVAGRMQKPGARVAIDLTGPEGIQVGEVFDLHAHIKLSNPSDHATYTWLIASGAESLGSTPMMGDLAPETEELSLAHSFRATTNNIHILLEVKSVRGESFSGELASFITRPENSGRGNVQFGVNRKSSQKPFHIDGRPMRVFQ